MVLRACGCLPHHTYLGKGHTWGSLCHYLCWSLCGRWQPQLVICSCFDAWFMFLCLGVGHQLGAKEVSPVVNKHLKWTNDLTLQFGVPVCCVADITVWSGPVVYGRHVLCVMIQWTNHHSEGDCQGFIILFQNIALQEEVYTLSSSAVHLTQGR